MIPVTKFRGLRFTAPQEHTTLEQVLQDIQGDRWKDRVLKCHQDLSKKNWLPCFTPTGVFNHRSLGGLQSYNGVICLDLDHLEDPESVKAQARELDWVRAAFITPSGKGLKVIVLTSSNLEQYKETEEFVAAKFLEATGVARDNRCKDVARIQFISYDPELYHNPESQVLNLDS